MEKPKVNRYQNRQLLLCSDLDRTYNSNFIRPYMDVNMYH